MAVLAVIWEGRLALTWYTVRVGLGGDMAFRLGEGLSRFGSSVVICFLFWQQHV
jgi:expansin (peptidoglycan-binding protein)